RLSRVFLPPRRAAGAALSRSLHDALPISGGGRDDGIIVGSDHPAACIQPYDAHIGEVVDVVARLDELQQLRPVKPTAEHDVLHRDRKSTRLNSSHDQTSYAVFCSKKKNHD